MQSGLDTLLSFTLQPLTEAIGFGAAELQDVGFVGQAVEQGGGEALITKDWVQSAKRRLVVMIRDTL